MKKNLIIGIALCIIAVVLLALFSCSRDDYFYGYVPVDQKPIYFWTEKIPGSGNYDCDPRLMVLSMKGDTISATFGTGPFGGSFAIRYRDTYPPVLGKKVYVRMQKINEVYLILDSSLEPYPNIVDKK